MTDKELYEKARFYGKNALLWRRKFMGLLPEVQRRRLYEKKGFSSVFEFSFKLAGLSEEQVRRVLQLERKFEGVPTLKNLLETGEVSVNKLARVASIATVENQEDLAEAVKILPQAAVETLVRDEQFQKLNGFLKPQIEVKSVRAHLNLDEKVTTRLLELQEKGLNLNEILTELLDKREQEIEEEKAAIVANLPEKQSRHVPARTKKVLQKEHGSKCAIPSCQKPAEQLHHTQTFALSHRHDPHYLAPLCKEHHVLAHSINVKVQQKRTEAVGLKSLTNKI
ncbi:MAG: hypothetical protein WC777_00875 [Candidatus Gracilibacteria bacterium]|jgi:hypothetical protein